MIDAKLSGAFAERGQFTLLGQIDEPLLAGARRQAPRHRHRGSGDGVEQGETDGVGERGGRDVDCRKVQRHCEQVGAHDHCCARGTSDQPGPGHR